MALPQDNKANILKVITGPTAAGKSSIAMELARRFDLAIISADSRQIYRGFDIGTAKPTVTDRAEVQHYGIDILGPELRYSAHAWANDATAWMRDVATQGRSSVVVGGTGFYIRALVRPLAPAPALDQDRRTKLESWLAIQDLELLKRWCARLDPSRAGLGRTQLLRAIETALLSGQRLGDVHTEHRHSSDSLAGNRGQESNEPREQAVNAHMTNADFSEVRYLVVDPGLPLADRIRLRVNEMMDGGWDTETMNLMKTVPENAPAWLSSGYGAMRQHVRGELSRAEVEERVVIETRQYAKRQRTWCRHQLTEGPVTRISSLEPDAVDRAIAWYNGTESHT